MQKGEKWRCANCGAEFVVTEPSRLRDTERPRCACGAGMKRPYTKPTIQRVLYHPKVEDITEVHPKNRRRSQRVLLQVAVLVRKRTPEGMLQAQAFTKVVNAHGGLMDAPFEMKTGEKITLVSPISLREAHCHVIRVDRPSDGYCPTAFEFDEPNPRFWPISFPPADWAVAEEVTED